MLELMIRAVIVGGLASGAAWLFENALAHARLPRRFAWTFALAATITLPFMPRLFESSPNAVVPQLTAPTIVLTIDAAAAAAPVDYAGIAWLITSLAVLGVFAIAYARLQRERVQWRRARVADDDVLMSQRFGPAVFGFAAPKIVVPEWVRATSQEEQRLIVLHEREHIRAGDQLQLLLSIIATIAMPWNPFVWLQSRRLKFTIEADCDQRVLAAAPDAARYAELLLDVGSRQLSGRSGMMLTPALAEHRNGLERRLVMLATKLIANRWKASGLLIVGLLVTAIACESRLPNEPQSPTPQGALTEASLPRMKQEGTKPDLYNSLPALMERYYPPTLQQAGIGGKVGIRIIVRASGVVEGHEIFLSSGHDALDQAALRVMRETQILPSRVRAGEQPTDHIEEYILEFDPKVGAKSTTVRRPKNAGALRPTMKADAIDQEQEPRYTPYTVMPKLQNRAEVMQHLIDYYPPLLRTAGVQGTVLLWVLVDETGKVVNAKVKETAGHPALDSAGVSVAKKMKFSPAKNKEESVKAWIQLPVVFKTK